MPPNSPRAVLFEEDLYIGPRHGLKHSGSNQLLGHKKSSSKLYAETKRPATPGVSAFGTKPLPYPSPEKQSILLPAPGINAVANQGYTLQPQASPIMGVPPGSPAMHLRPGSGMGGIKQGHKKQKSSIRIPLQVAPPYSNQPPLGLQQHPHQHLHQKLPQPYPGAFNSNPAGMSMPAPFAALPAGHYQPPHQQHQQHPFYPTMMHQQHPNNFLGGMGVPPYFQPAPPITSQLAQLNQKIIDITNRQTKKKNKQAKQLPPGYKFNPDAFTTPFDSARLLNCLQIVTHQLNEKAEINEYLLLRPFAKDYVSESGTRITVEYDEDKETYVIVATDKVYPMQKEDYVGVRTVGVVTDDDLFYTILEFIPLPINGGRETRPKKGERPVPLETFRGWSSLVIMEARKRKALSMLD
ncbi:hypothetical protein, no similarity [Geotrichum candidum]|uniref:Uncharacterized protein n=2 Tax=Geotrichum candidum TaxID=1173061 RepID=A0A0J9XGW1_GEOCN|nr:hypothetical protein, no similarity [Geotrichum candidum]